MTDGKLLSGQFLQPEQTLVSVGGQARLHNQGDGNLVVYLNGDPFWASHTDGQSAGILKMRADGNLVLTGPDGRGRAHTGTTGHPGAMVQLQDDGNFVLYEDPNGPQAGTPIWASSTGVFVIADVEPEPAVPGRPLIGPLRVEQKMFRDDTGFRRVFFASWFPALRILRDNPAEFTRQIDAIAAAGYQGFRTFLAVGGWSDFWDGREVVPVGFRKWLWTGNHLRTDQYGVTLDAWPNYDDLLRTMLRACRAKKLRLHVTTGDMQAICPDTTRELDLHRRFARICAEEGGTDVIALAEATNEFPLNREGGDSPTSIEQMGRILRVWRDAIPGALVAQGAIPQNEEPESLTKASTHGDLCMTHTTRDPIGTALKRTFGLVYYEGDYRGFPKAFWQGEPAGPGQDSYQRLDEPASLVALYAMHGLTGQASNFFQGAAVRSRSPLESEWGFSQLPELLAAHLPEDVATWERSTAGNGAILYWSKGKDFRAVTFNEWNSTPPRPVTDWTLHRGDSTQYGTGAPPNRTGLLVGHFQ